MFRLIEFLVLAIILWIIVNLLRYAGLRASGYETGDQVHWLIGLSEGWLRKDEAKLKGGKYHG